MIELAPGVHALGHGAGGRVRAFLIADGGELTLVDPLIERDARLVLEAIHALGRTPSDLKRIGITHTHRSHLSGLAELKHRSGATAYAHPWEADIVGGQRRAQPVTLLPKQSLRLLPFQIGLRLNLRSTPRAPSTSRSTKATLSQECPAACSTCSGPTDSMDENRTHRRGTELMHPTRCRTCRCS